MKPRSVLPALLATALLSACATQTLDVPRAGNYPASDQQKARAVHHWDVLAEDVAGRIAENMQQRAPGQAVYIMATAENAGSFNQAFRKLLLTRLMAKGVEVATRPGAEVADVNFDVQVIRHNSPVSNGIQFKFTSLAAGIAVVRDLFFQHSTTAYTLIGLAAAAGLDAASLVLDGNAASGPTRSEVLVTTTVESGHRYLASTSDVYYIERADASLFDSIKNWKVVGQ
ncbi:hypothetical protein GCM10011419_25110 [Vogesella fluminis]|uniref:Lipoprotein n=1 Tax=Vogesella fluminis TaxID=1069161 RepID=A0ABQ3HBH0_9NEIS|nr:hypothetical protein GCM10011419_25110 [Vogesella fluminis]